VPTPNQPPDDDVDALKAALAAAYVSLGQHKALLGALEPALPQLVGNADLPEGRLTDRQRNDGFLNLLRHAVLQHRLLAADFLQGQFAGLVVELLNR
jgi:hypothetical protein